MTDAGEGTRTEQIIAAIDRLQGTMVTIAAKQAAQQITLVKLASICGDTPSRDQLVRDLRRTARAGLTHSSAREDSVRKIWDEVFTLAEEIASVR